MIGVRGEVTYAFFDKAAVIRETDANTRKALSRVGGRIRKYAQYSMRPGRGNTAPAGSPPYTHKKKLLKRMLYYAWDKERKSVVVGPVLLQRTRDQGIPALLEKGGTQVVPSPEKGVILKQYEGNPYMVPALVENQGFITEAFDAVKGAKRD